MQIKKILTLLVAVAMMAAVFAACGSSNQPAPQAEAPPANTPQATTPAAPAPAETAPEADEEMTLRISWWGNQLRNETTQAMLDAYTAMKPSVTFEAEFTDWSGYWDKLATQAAGGNLPDIIQQDYAYIAQYHARNQLANLTTQINAGNLNVDDVPESILATGRFNGDLYALCIGVNAVCTFYNSTAAEAAGVDLSGRISYQDIMDASAKIFEATGKTGTTPGGHGSLQMMSRDVGELVYDGQKVGAGEATVLRYFEQVQATITSPWATPVDVLQEDTTAGLEGHHMPTGRGWLLFPGGTNQLAAVQNATEDKIKIAFYPRSNSGYTHESSYLRPSQFFSITETSNYKEEAARVIDFYTNAEAAQDCLQAERGVPVNPKMADYLRPKLSEAQQEIFAFIAQLTDIATPFDPPQPNGASEANRLLDDLTDLVRYGQLTPQQAAERWLPEANDILARASD